MIVWSRLRRSRGFGIHSPFAFDLVLRTLRERDHYYAYAELEALRDEARRAGAAALPSAGVLRLVVRLTARFQPRRVMVSGDPTGLIAKAVALTDSRVTFTSDAPTMAILSGRDDTPEAVAAAAGTVARGGVALLLDRRPGKKAAEAITAPMKRGMTFTSRRKLLAVGARHLPRQNFDINY